MPMNEAQPEVTAPPPPRARLCIGVTGHREDHPSFVAQSEAIGRALDEVLSLIDATVRGMRERGADVACTRLHSLLADGTDLLAANGALQRNWELVAPLPFGQALNVAINAHPEDVDDARALLAGAGGVDQVRDSVVRERALRLFAVAAQARRFELADRDSLVAQLYLEQLAQHGNTRGEAIFAAESSLRVARAGRVMIEQSDLVIALWDGATRSLIGGTGHTIQVALEAGTPVLCIDAHHPQQWRILRGPESLVGPGGEPLAPQERNSAVAQLVTNLVGEPATHSGHRGQRGRSGNERLSHEIWPTRSRWIYHAYRRTEALFGTQRLRDRFRNLVQTYETPDAILTGSAAQLRARARALPAQEPAHVDRIDVAVLRRFAWADGVSAYLSDIYRGGMTASFLFASLAIIGGIAYLPFSDSHHKWIFASFELLLLVGILSFAIIGHRRRWHARWFETRRVAEYLRHAPILLLLGVARAPGRWAQGTDTSWPERCARNALREVGLPQLVVTQAFLRQATQDLLQDHVRTQREYHVAKARRLRAVHRNLDHASQVLFALAIVSVAAYLVCKGGGVLGWWSMDVPEDSSYFFTFLGVLLPTLGGSLAGVRYFGDFERFAAISGVTAEKLQGIETRISQLLLAPDDALDYGSVADLAHAADDVVVTEIESWQSVFAGKHVTVPV
jgi:hypothetical protein